MRSNNEFDKIEKPLHYNQYRKFEVIEITEQLNFTKGNAIKYILRAGWKAGQEVDDLKKAIWYLQREIKNIENSVYENPKITV